MGGSCILTLLLAQPHMRMPMEPGVPHAHQQPGAGGGCHVRLPKPRRVAGGDTGGAGTPERGLDVT